MEEGKVLLMAQEFNEWMEVMRQEITRVRDNLMLLEAEERRLSEIWESGAKESWELELQRILEQVWECAAKMETLTGKAESRARNLAEMEKIMLQAAESL